MTGFEWLPQINVTSLFTGGSFAVVFIALIRAWPVLALQAYKAKAALRAEQRDDLSDCKQEMKAMGLRMDGLYIAVNNLKIELAGVLSAYRILEVAEQRRDPQSLPLAQARAVLSSAFSIAPATEGMPPQPPAPLRDEGDEL